MDIHILTSTSTSTSKSAESAESSWHLDIEKKRTDEKTTSSQTKSHHSSHIPGVLVTFVQHFNILVVCVKIFASRHESQIYVQKILTFVLCYSTSRHEHQLRQLRQLRRQLRRSAHNLSLFTIRKKLLHVSHFCCANYKHSVPWGIRLVPTLVK